MKEKTKEVSTMNTHKIAVIAGDGIGPEVISVGVKVLRAVAEIDGGFSFEFTDYPWGCEYYLKNGRMMPENGIEELKNYLSSSMTLSGRIDIVRKELGDFYQALSNSLYAVKRCRCKWKRTAWGMLENLLSYDKELQNKFYTLRKN
jgi:hypothetical protein